MILRRVTKHVQDQNWFAVALDFVIVVFGVFIGLQVANWNEDRQARADENAFLIRLHADVVQAEEKSARLRSRRFTQKNEIVSGLSVVFRQVDQQDLTQDQCLYIAFSGDYVLTTPSIPAFDELLSSGRLDILRDQELKRALSGFNQSLEVLSYWVSWGTRDNYPLSDTYPELIQLESYFDEERGEVWTRGICDTEGMRNNQRFLNNLSVNADTFDGFVRDALDPWNTQLSTLHDRLDVILSIEHSGDT